MTVSKYDDALTKTNSNDVLEKGQAGPATDYPSVAAAEDGNLAEDALAVNPGNSEHDQINYKTMGWVKAGFLLLAETIALGVLSFPSAYHRLGMVPGLMVTFALSIMSTWTGYVLIQFKVNHPGVLNFADAGRVIAGRKGGIFMGIFLAIKVTFVASSHSLSGAIALSSISSDAVCSIAYAAIISFVSFLLMVPRTFEKVSYICFLSVSCILVACMITIVGTGTQSLETLQKATDKDLGPVTWYISNNTGLTDSIGALTNIIFGYAGHVAILSFCSEMKQPRDFKKSLALVQVGATTVYIIVGATIYAFTGGYVTSPALTATAPALRITAYSIALISIIVSGVVASYVCAKFIWVELFRGTPILTENSYKAWSYWITICAIMWTIAFILGEVIPFFNQLLSITSAFFSNWLTFGLSGVLWLYDNHAKRSHAMPMASGPGGWFASPTKTILTLSAFGIILFSAAITGLGAYSSIKSIADGYSKGTYSHPFSCSASG
ncbi:unnamed protein product [Sympodiomycopsis kandeliae]